MIIHCLLAHKWVGCKCVRCGQARDMDHAWAGCQCRRCGLVRAIGHDLVTVRCRLICRRCGCDKGPIHDWDRCICRRCGTIQHLWIGSRCWICGIECLHREYTVKMIGPDSPITNRGTVFRVCKACGVEIGQVAWK